MLDLNTDTVSIGNIIGGVANYQVHLDPLANRYGGNTIGTVRDGIIPRFIVSKAIFWRTLRAILQVPLRRGITYSSSRSPYTQI